MKARGFSIVELIVVVAILAILLALLLPALSGAKTSAKKVSCMDNERQLGAAFLIYANDDSKQSFGGSSSNLQYWPFVDENWLRGSANLSVKIFFCPLTSNGRDALKAQKNSYIDLAAPALQANSPHGYSYDPLLWFADMEDFWNGNTDSRNTSRFVPKTVVNVGSYAHANEAFDMEGKKFGPSSIWLMTDNDIITGNKFWPEPNNNHGADGANTVFADGHAEWISSKVYVYKYETSQDNNRTRATIRPHL